MLLGRDSRIRTGRVDERDQREAVALGELHRSHGLAIALGIGHPEVPLRALACVSALLVPDHGNRPAVKASEPGDEGGILRPGPISVQLHEVLEQPLDVVERVRAVVVPCELDKLPDFLVGSALLDALELALQALELTRQPRPPQKRQAAETAQPLANTKLGFTRHVRRGAGASPGSRAARAGARSRQRARSGSWTRRGRSPRAASRGSCPAPRAGRSRRAGPPVPPRRRHRGWRNSPEHPPWSG